MLDTGRLDRSWLDKVEVLTNVYVGRNSIKHNSIGQKLTEQNFIGQKLMEHNSIEQKLIGRNSIGQKLRHHFFKHFL